MSGSGISWAICKSVSHSREITTPAAHRSVFYRPGALPAAQPTVSNHWRLKCTKFDFRPDPARGAYSTPIDLLAVFMGAYFREGRRTEGEWKGEGIKEKRRREEKEGEGKVFAGPMSNYFQRACERLHGKTHCLFVCIRRPSFRKDHIRHEQPWSELIFFAGGLTNRI